VSHRFENAGVRCACDRVCMRVYEKVRRVALTMWLRVVCVRESETA